MKEKVESFGHIFQVGDGIYKDYYMYCYKDSDDINQHSAPFVSLAECSQAFAQKFSEYTLNGMIEWINEK